MPPAQRSKPGLLRRRSGGRAPDRRRGVPRRQTERLGSAPKRHHHDVPPSRSGTPCHPNRSTHTTPGPARTPAARGGGPGRSSPSGCVHSVLTASNPRGIHRVRGGVV